MSSTNKRLTVRFDFDEEKHICSLSHPDLEGLPEEVRMTAEAAVYCLNTLRVLRWMVRDVLARKLHRKPPPDDAGCFQTGDVLLNTAEALKHMLAWMGPRYESLRHRWLAARSRPFAMPGYGDMLSSYATTAHAAVYDLSTYACASLFQEKDGTVRLEDVRIPEAENLLVEVIEEARSAAKRKPERLRLNDLTLTVWLDGVPSTVEDQDAYRAFKMLTEAAGKKNLTWIEIGKALGHERAERLKDRLPERLQDLIQAKRGRGVWLALPIDPSDVNTQVF
jgi:hypothetical protein